MMLELLIRSALALRMGGARYSARAEDSLPMRKQWCHLRLRSQTFGFSELYQADCWI